MAANGINERSSQANSAKDMVGLSVKGPRCEGRHYQARLATCPTQTRVDQACCEGGSCTSASCPQEGPAARRTRSGTRRRTAAAAPSIQSRTREATRGSSGSADEPAGWGGGNSHEQAAVAAVHAVAVPKLTANTLINCLTVARYHPPAARRWTHPLEGGAAQARGQQQ